jgi:hypothetical protein
MGSDIGQSPSFVEAALIFSACVHSPPTACFRVRKTVRPGLDRWFAKVGVSERLHSAKRDISIGLQG